jgi:predicted metal-dependent hydrolase
LFVRHPKAKRYIVRVAEDGSVRVTIPRWGSKRDAKTFVESQHKWIVNERERLERQRAQSNLEVSQDTLVGLRARALHELPPRLLQLAAEHGLRVKRVSIRNQKWRWGSCSPDGHICLNWRLVVMPDWVRDYVLIHEIMHLKRLDHSRAFWKLVGSACPKYREARIWLRQNDRLLRDCRT